jgi:RND family efflux transporter MFP subunit
MSLDKQLLSAQIAARIPPQVKSKWLELKARYLAASKNAQIAIAGGGALVLVLFIVWLGSGSDAVTGGVTFEVRRGKLDITVLEGGTLEALQSQEIRSEVKGRDGVKILRIVEEGYRISQEDVDSGLVLVELDTAQLIDEQLNQEIAVETAEASYIERRAQFEIQLNQNMTDLNDARQNMRFARLDFEKFLGGTIVKEIIDELQIEQRLAKMEAADLAAMEVASREIEATDMPEAAAAAPALEFDPAAIDSMPPQMQERIRQTLAENGGTLPPEMLERMQRFQQGGGGFGGGQGGGFGGAPGGGGFAGGPGGGRGNRTPGAGAPTTQAPVESTPTPSEPTELVLTKQSSSPPDSTAQLLMDDSYMLIRNGIDFTRYANIEILEDGEAKQQLRSLEDDLQVAQQELLLAQDRIEGQRRLEDRAFITPTELEAEELNLNKARNKMAEKETALKLYIQYTFPKDAEKKLSDYENAVMRYQRQLKENIAEQAQEEARFSSAERKYNLERVKLADINKQLENAVIRAKRPGLVVYGAADQNSQRFRGNNQEAIQEGATVRERQPILTIPDMRKMAVKVNIHESAVQRIIVGQQVNVLVDAFPDQKLTGVVTKVAVVADSANSFMNPDLKVYPTTITIDGTHDWLRPGMSAEVEILVDTLDDAIYVPLQAVTYYNDQRVVYVSRGGRAERRPVEVGTFSESFIQITSGLSPGEEVLLLAPQQTNANAGA